MEFCEHSPKPINKNRFEGIRRSVNEVSGTLPAGDYR